MNEITFQAYLMAVLFAWASSLNSLQDRKAGCRPTADVIFLLDGSDSISDREFNQQREFIRRFIQQSDVSSDAIRVGLTVVSSVIGDEVPLSMNSTKHDLLRAVDGLTQPQEGSRTDLGLVEMERLFGLNARRGVSRVGVLLTDGRAKYIRATEAEAHVVKDAGVFLVTVGVGRLIKFSELEKIASTRSNAYSMEPLELSTKYLTETVNFLGQESCAGLQLVNTVGVSETLPLSPNETVTLDFRLAALKPSRVTGAPLNIETDTSAHARSKPGSTLLNAKPDASSPSSGVKSGQLLLNTKVNGLLSRSQIPLGFLGLNLQQPDATESLTNALTNMKALSEAFYNILNDNGTSTSTDLTLQDTTSLYPTTDFMTQTTPTYTPSVVRIAVQTTPPTAPTIPSVTEAPKPEFKYETGPSPTVIANNIIQSLLARMNNTQQLPPQLQKPTSQLKDTVGASFPVNPGAASSVGVKVQLKEPSAAETLDFLKRRMKPPRTVEEHLNPIFRMFDGVPKHDKMSYRHDVQGSATGISATTLSPEQAYKRAQMSSLRDQCSKGRFVDGVAYTLKPGSCTEFLQCFQNNGGLKVQVASCPFEAFFDDQQSVCRYHKDQMCWTDPCADKVTTSYQHDGNCRAYWLCERGHSVPACCLSGTSYVTGFGCARNVSCTDTCMDFGNLKTVTQASDCKLLAMDTDPHYYFEHVAGMGWLVRMCAQGSKFEQAYCKCIGSNEVVVDKCRPEMHMDFNGGLMDISGNNLAIGIYNVDLDGGTGAFYGNSHIKLWRFSGMSLGQHVTISFRFRTGVTATKGKLMHLVSNCCHGCDGQPQPSLDIAIIPGDQGGVAVFSTKTKQAGETFLFVPFKDTFTGWNNLAYKYDGIRMKGEVNGQTAQKPVVGDIEGRPDPLLIGACGINNAYDGLMDEFKFYMCNL